MAAVRQVWSIGRHLPVISCRGYVAAASTELVKAPIQVFGIEGRYAHALYSAASKNKAVDKVEKELTQFQKMMSEQAVLSNFMKDPTLNKRQKASALKDVLGSQKYSDITVNLFGTLVENNRLNRTLGVIKAYQTIMSACRGEVPCVVTTAKALSDKNRKELETILQKFLEKNQVLKLELKLDPSLIGGMVVDLGDKFIDMSTQTKIKKIVKTLSESL